MRPTIFLAVAAACLAPAAAAAEPVPVPAFRSISLEGGGRVSVRPGAVQRVELVQGDRNVSSFEVEDGQLRIRACRRSCSDYRLRVVIVTPDVEGLAIRGGGGIEVAPGFRPARSLSLAVSGGGGIDADALAAGSVNAAINGGGSIEAAPRTQLNAAINGGGSIRYRGEPQVHSAVRGGGSVSRMRGN